MILDYQIIIRSLNSIIIFLFMNSNMRYLKKCIFSFSQVNNADKIIDLLLYIIKLKTIFVI